MLNRNLLGAALLGAGLAFSSLAHSHAAGGAAAATAATPAAHAATAARATPARTITEAQVLAAQQAWGRALVQISSDFASGGIARATATASAVLDAAYGYQMGPVLFKPTLTTAPHTFRTTREGALAYFVGNNPAFPNDRGFALKGWTNVEVRNAAVLIHGDVAKTMGNVTLTNRDGSRTTVDKTWGYRLDPQGNLRIVLHHSSLPFTGS